MAMDESQIIRGKKVILRPTTRNDLGDLMELWNDGRVMRWVGFPEGMGYDRKRMTDWLAWIESDSCRHHFVVHAEPPGFCGEVCCDIDGEHRRAGLDIKFRPDAQGQGLAADSLGTLIRWVFESFGDVDAVWTEPSEENVPAQKLYRRCHLVPRPRPLDMEQGHPYWELKRQDWRAAQ